ncbi:MAG: OsmC family protein [Myxococcota bacterium]
MEARNIPASHGRLSSKTIGEVEKEDNVLVIRRIHVTYHLKTDPDLDVETVNRVMGFHARYCPVYRSLHPQIQISVSLEMHPNDETP